MSHWPYTVSKKSPDAPFAFVPRPISPDVMSENMEDDEFATITIRWDGGQSSLIKILGATYLSGWDTAIEFHLPREDCSFL